MISSKKSVQHLAAVLMKKGITDIVFSPGSRNAPLINTFSGLPGFRCLNIVDERSAAFFALGMALEKRRPVAVACTSGSAVLNYAPALVEAFYQKVPLLAITADRPPEWIDQGDGQTIRQDRVYKNYIKGSFTLPHAIDRPADIWFAERRVNQAVNTLLFPEPGPVHINVPFSEPLYELTGQPPPEVKTITLHWPERRLSGESMDALADLWNGCPRKMILVGQTAPDPRIQALLSDIATDPSVAVLTETLSNVFDGRFIGSIDRTLAGAGSSVADLAPELLLTIGGQVVSKKIKAFLRQYRPKRHVHVSFSAAHTDTLTALTDVAVADPVLFLSDLKERVAAGSGEFGRLWRDLSEITRHRAAAYVKGCAFSDLKVFNAIVAALPPHGVVHLSNSTPVRYAQLFSYEKPLSFRANRGVSGIDGVVSTAAGASSVSSQSHTLITGDLAFLYDSNALFNRHLTANLRIIVIHNGGGGIFRFIDGPAGMPELETHYEARHHQSAADVARAYGLACSTADDERTLADGLEWLYTTQFDQPALLEVTTPTEVNAPILKGFFASLKA